MMLFSLGRVVATPGALEILKNNEIHPGDLLSRHIIGDWGELSTDDSLANDEAVKTGEDRILSSYCLKDKSEIWVITEGDRSATTLLLPSEY